MRTIRDDLLLDSLNPAQREAVTHSGGPVLVVAGAGSGKTRVLTHRIAYLIYEFDVDPFSILAITFTNRAASEMVERVSALLGARLSPAMWVRTFHSACVRILRREAQVLGYRNNFSIYDEADSERLVATCMKELAIEDRHYSSRAIKAKISSLKNQMVAASTFAQQMATTRDEVVAKVYERYDQRLIEASAMDFDDLLTRTVTLFHQNREILEHYRACFAHILVDEFQDTNRVQWELVRLLGHEHGNIFCVGDADQSIYRFRGAEVSNMASFEREIPGTRVVKLEQNYRSTQKILNAANAVIAKNSSPHQKNLWSDLGPGDPVTIVAASDERSEAEWICEEIVRLVEGGEAEFGEIAVFYRTNAQSRTLEEALAGVSIPYRVIGGTRFYDRREIRDALAYLRLISNTADSVSLRRVVNIPRRGIGETTIRRLTEHASGARISLFDAMCDAEHCPGLSTRSVRQVKAFVEMVVMLRDQVNDASTASLLDLVLDSSGYAADLAEQESIEASGRIENLSELRGVAVQFDQDWEAGFVEQEPEASPGIALLGMSDGERRLAAFLERVGLVADVDSLANSESSVTLMTLHNAKGLEFPVVFMTGMEEGIFPHARSMSEREELEEERRICYVGITRAGRRLYLTRAWSRNLFGVLGTNPPSRFLAEIPKELVREIGIMPDKWQQAEASFTQAHVPNGSQHSRPFSDSEAMSRANRQSRSRRRDVSPLQLGDDVYHDKWGEGVVVELEGHGDDAQALVRFPSVGEKRLLLAWAPLSRR